MRRRIAPRPSPRRPSPGRQSGWNDRQRLRRERIGSAVCRCTLPDRSRSVRRRPAATRPRSRSAARLIRGRRTLPRTSSRRSCRGGAARSRPRKTCPPAWAHSPSPSLRGRARPTLPGLRQGRRSATWKRTGADGACPASCHCCTSQRRSGRGAGRGSRRCTRLAGGRRASTRCPRWCETEGRRSLWARRAAQVQVHRRG